MASTYSPLKIELIGTGEQSGTWGSTTNTNLGTAIEQAIVGRGTANFTTNADLTLTLANTNASQVARNLVLNVTSGVSLTTTRNLIVPAINKPYLIQNNTTGGQSIVVKNSTGNGVTVPNGASAFVYNDGTNVVDAITRLTTLSVGDITSTGTVAGANISTTGNLSGNNLAYTGTLTGNAGIINIGSGQIYKDGSGNVGIGTSTPGARLEIKTATDKRLFFASADVLSGLRIESVNDAGNANQGLQFNGNPFAWISNGTERMRIDASGNVGIGTTSPASKLEVQSATGATYARFGNSYGTLYLETVSGGANRITSLNAANNASHPFAVNGAGGVEWMRIDASGNVGIGTTSTDAKLRVSGSATVSSQTNVAARIGTSIDSDLLLGSVNGNTPFVASQGAFPLGFYTNATERMRITSGGRLLVGQTANMAVDGTTIAGFQVNRIPGLCEISRSEGDALALQRTTTNGPVASFWRNTTSVGNIAVDTTSTTYNTSSDYRLKENIQPMTGALAKVALLKPCTYIWKVDGSDGEGFIAHELQEVVPQCVTGDKDEVDAEGKPKYQGVDTSFLVATLTAAIQEQQVLIDQLKGRLDAANL